MLERRWQKQILLDLSLVVTYPKGHLFQEICLPSKSKARADEMMVQVRDSSKHACQSWTRRWRQTWGVSARRNAKCGKWKVISDSRNVVVTFFSFQYTGLHASVFPSLSWSFLNQQYSTYSRSQNLNCIMKPFHFEAWI